MQPSRLRASNSFTKLRKTNLTSRQSAPLKRELRSFGRLCWLLDNLSTYTLSSSICELHHNLPFCLFPPFDMSFNSSLVDLVCEHLDIRAHFPSFLVGCQHPIERMQMLELPCAIDFEVIVFVAGCDLHGRLSLRKVKGPRKYQVPCASLPFTVISGLNTLCWEKLMRSAKLLKSSRSSAGPPGAVMRILSDLVAVGHLDGRG